MTNLNRGSIPIDIGSRLELMVDDHLVARLSGGAQRPPEQTGPPRNCAAVGRALGG